MRVTLTGMRSWFSVDISVTLTICTEGGEKYTIELRNVVELPLAENTISRGMVPVDNIDGNTRDMLTDEEDKGFTEET